MRISWSRRIGAALGLLVLGGSIVLAGQALDDGEGSPGPAATPAASRHDVPPAPTLAQPAEALVAASTADIEVEIPPDLTPRNEYRLRIYVNEDLVREQRLPRGTEFTFSDVPLEQGDNWISAAIEGPGGEGLHSPTIHLVRDDEPPLVHVSSPAGRHLYQSDVVLRGRTEAGARLTIRNQSSDETFELEIGPDGRFEVRLSLAMGENVIRLRAVDAAGNGSRATVRLVRHESKASVTLEAHPASLKVAELPATVDLRARIVGLEGEPLDGAPVIFSISVPGQQTSTYQTTSRGGTAVWRGIRVPQEGARPGPGLATVMVVVGAGQDDEMTLQESASITFR